MTEEIRYVEEALRELDARLNDLEKWLEDDTIGSDNNQWVDAMEMMCSTVLAAQNGEKFEAETWGRIEEQIDTLFAHKIHGPREQMESNFELMTRIREWLNSTLLDIQRP